VTWTLSRFRAGEVVEVRSREEILATLDAQGCLDGVPFMPEMLRFCGQSFPVRAVAHKTCETALATGQGRRLDATVHLANLRCDGSAHGGCEADCTLYWKDAWLRPTNEPATSVRRTPLITEAELLASVQARPATAGQPAFFTCQATQITGATAPLAWWDLRQYAYDVSTGNHSLGHVLSVGWLAVLRMIYIVIEPVPGVRGVFRRFTELMHRAFTGRPAPSLFGEQKPLVKTPSERLDLRAGEWVRIKPKHEIERTLDKGGKNRGLSFDPEEMAPYCGGVYRVRRSVTRLVDERTGEMRQMKEPCIILEDVVCKAEYARCRLNCPRAFYSFWRELWLERVDAPCGGS